MTLATIDIGTNTTLLLVASACGPDVTVLEERAEITRLGRGIGHNGALDGEAIARTLAVLREFAAAARRHQARIAAIGTEALRRAPNAAAFLDPAAEILGTQIEVIDGEREAALTFRAVVASFPDLQTGPLAVVDIGGGSTEIVLASGGIWPGPRVEMRVSSIEFVSEPGTRTRLFVSPPSLTSESLIKRASEVGVVIRAFQFATAEPPGWWHCEQFAARY